MNNKKMHCSCCIPFTDFIIRIWKRIRHGKIQPYQPVHLVQSEFEIEKLLSVNDELPKAEFFPPPEQSIHLSQINGIVPIEESMDGSYDFNNNIEDTQLFFTCTDHPSYDSEDDLFKDALESNIDDSFCDEIDFFSSDKE